MSKAEERPTAEMISMFWDRWVAVKDDVATAMSEFRTEEYGPTLTKIVEALHPGLLFALQAGLSSRNALAFGAATPDAEQAVRRLLDAAPEPDELWEYTDVITGPGDVRDLVWVVGDIEVRMREALAQFVELPVEDPRELMVAVYHPLWSRLAEEEVFEIVAGTLDKVCHSALEAGYEVRGGPIPEEPPDPIDLGECMRRIDQLVEERT